MAIKQFMLRICENGEQITCTAVPNPFVDTTIIVKPKLRTRLRLIFGKPIRIYINLEADRTTRR